MRFSTQTAKRLVAGAAAAGALILGSVQLDKTLGEDEGDVPVPYKDIAGIVTVCRGYTGPKPIVWGKVYTAAECNELNAGALDSTQQALVKAIKVPVSQEEFDAYSSLAYNIGVSAFRSSTLLKLLNQGQYEAACAQILRWDKARVNGVLRPVKGLTTRRKKEYNLCMTPVDLPENIVAVAEPVKIEEIRIDNEPVKIVVPEVQAPTSSDLGCNWLQRIFLRRCTL